MKMSIIIVIISYLTNNLIISQDESDDTTTELTILSCREKTQLIGSVETDKYELIEVLINETMILECRYCNETESNKAKIWYYMQPFNITPQEVPLGMHKNESLNRISVSLQHELTVHHVNMEDYGIYYCRSLEDNISEKMLNYIIEITDNITKPIERGNMSNWKQYHEDYMIPINKKFLESIEYEYMFIRENLSTKLEVITHWEQKYRPCEVCGRPQGEGRQEKYGYCRIKIENNITDVNKLPYFNSSYEDDAKNSSEKIKYFLKLPQISCRSLLLKELFYSISEMTEILADFVLVRRCSGVCNPDARGINRGWKFSSSKKYKYRRTMVLKEGEHLTLVCPESNLDNEIIWRRNGKVIKPSETVTDEHTDINKIHVVVDAFNSLYLMHVTEEQSGNYTCQVDQIRMQQIIIYVKSKSRLLTEAFLRHMMYLAVILVLSCTCYCAGCIAACKRKHKFKRYEDIYGPVGYVCDCNSSACKVPFHYDDP